MAPEAPDVDKVADPKRIAIPDEEVEALGLADPHGPEATEFLEKNGLKFGDTIIVEGEGDAPASVFTLDEKDFFTRLRQESEDLNNEPEPVLEAVPEIVPETDFNQVAMEHAEPIMGEAPPLTAEQEELHEEAAEDMGETAAEQVVEVETDEEPAVEAVPEAPIGDFDQQLELFEGDRKYEIKKTIEKAEEAIEAALKELSNEAERIDQALVPTGQLEEIGTNVSRLVFSLENHQASGAVNIIQGIAGELRAIQLRLSRVASPSENKIPKSAELIKNQVDLLISDLATSDKKFQNILKDLGSRHGKTEVPGSQDELTADARNILSGMGSEIDTFVADPANMKGDTETMSVALGDIAKDLEEFSMKIGHGPIETNDLASLATRIKRLSGEPMSRISPKIEGLKGMIRQKINNAYGATGTIS